MNKKLSDTLIERGVTELEVDDSGYYTERYLYKQHTITNDITCGYLAWPGRQVRDRNWTEPKRVATLTGACDRIDEYHEAKQKLIDALACEVDTPTQMVQSDYAEELTRQQRDQQDAASAILIGTQILKDKGIKVPTEPNYSYVACGGGGNGGSGSDSSSVKTDWIANPEVDGKLKRDEIEDRIEQKVSYLDSHGCIHESQQAAINNEVLYDLGEIIEKYAHGQDMEVIWEDDSIVYQLALMLVRRKDEIMDLLYVYEEDKK